MWLLQDVDDNIPLFERDLYTATLRENAPPGVSVTQMIANDPDSAKNSEVVYRLVTSDTAGFAIDSATGIVTSTRTFDYETTPFVDLVVRAANPAAADSEDSSLYSEAVLRVEIEGENEFYPKFSQPIFHFAVSEVSNVGGVVGQVEAVDADAGPDADVFYYLIGGNTKGFKIDRKTGVIRLDEV